MIDDGAFRHDSSARVSRLVPDGQKVITVHSEACASEALAIMLERSFSQLPVVVGEEVIGTFTHQSFTSRFHSDAHIDSRTFPVSEFLRKPPLRFFRMTDHYGEILSSLFEHGAVLVGERENLQGIVSTADALQFLSDASRPYMLIRECELSIRRLIRTVFTEEHDLKAYCSQALRKLHESGETHIPDSLELMTLGELKILVEFSFSRADVPLVGAFGSKDLIRMHISSLAKIRNKIMHFRSEVTHTESAELESCREWLENRTKLALRRTLS